MVSGLWALLLLTFAVAAATAIAPAPSPTVDLDLTGEKFLNFRGPMKCWRVIENVEGCAKQFLQSLVGLNIKFFPSCCKALLGLPFNCIERIFPLHIFGISFSDQINKLCHQFPGAQPQHIS